MTTRQRERKNSLASWGQQIVGAALAVGGVWVSMQQILPAIIAPIVNAHMDSMRKEMYAFVDSTKGDLIDTMRVDIHRAVQATTEQVGLIAMEQDGKTVYSPRIVVQADTMGLKLVNARLDTLGREVDGLNSSVNFIVNLPLFQAARPAHNRRPK